MLSYLSTLPNIARFRDPSQPNFVPTIDHAIGKTSMVEVGVANGKSMAQACKEAEIAE
jgi:hypothetical protein